ncbi:MAG: MBL fold metallo-hydrolase, partial [Coprobacillaceae bacterium]
MSDNKVITWGCRGSCVTTDFRMMKYGFNTTCISIETEDTIYLVDAGSGITDFDKYYYENQLFLKKIILFFTHYHHDHLWGLGFTEFLFDNKVVKEIIGTGNIKSIINRYFGPPFFPVQIVNLNNLIFKSIHANSSYTINGLTFDTILLKHTQKCIGYKFYLGEKTFSIILDYDYRNDKN